MELDHHVTQDKYLEYLIATQSKWNFYDLSSHRRYYQIFKAMETNTRVKQFFLHCGLHGGLTEADLIKFSASLEKNQSIEGLKLRGLLENAELALVEIFNVLARKPNFSCFEFYDFIPPLAWRAFLEFIRAQTKLKQLTLRQLTENKVLELMDALNDNDELLELNLIDDNGGTVESLRAIARYVSKSTKLTRLSLYEEDNLTQQTADELIEMMQNNTSLRALNSYGKLDNCAFVKRNADNYNRSIKEASRKQNISYEPRPALPEPDVSLGSWIEQLPMDIIKVILWQLPIKPLCQFKRANKWFYSSMNDNFWRGYYLTYFSTIPSDVFALTDLTYGLKLMTADSLDHVKASLWEEIVINSCRARNISADVFPTNYCVSPMEPVYRYYPQLIGTKLTECAVDVFPPDRMFLKTKDAPYANTWFTTFANNSAVYHLGFEKLHDGQYNGIVLLAPDSEWWSNRFYDMVYMFEWFAAQTEAEFIEKMKPLCEVYLTARDFYNHNGPFPMPIYAKIPALLQRATATRAEILKTIDSIIEHAAKDYCVEHGINETNSPLFISQVTELTRQFKEDAPSLETEFEKFKQKMPARSDLNRKYEWNGLYHDFNSYSWKAPTNNSHKSNNIRRRKKHSSQTGPVALMKLYRVVMNSTLMAVLRIFWPMDIADPDCELFPWVKDARTLYKDLYCPKRYTRYDDISVASASPSQWPLIAVSLAKLLLPSLIAVVNGLVLGRHPQPTETIVSILNRLKIIQIKLK